MEPYVTPTPGPSRPPSRLTLPPMMMYPVTHHLDYHRLPTLHDEHDPTYLPSPVGSFTRHPFHTRTPPSEYECEYDCPGPMRPEINYAHDHPLPRITQTTPSIGLDCPSYVDSPYPSSVPSSSSSFGHPPSSLSISLLLAAANATNTDHLEANGHPPHSGLGPTVYHPPSQTAHPNSDWLSALASTGNHAPLHSPPPTPVAAHGPSYPMRGPGAGYDSRTVFPAEHDSHFQASAGFTSPCCGPYDKPHPASGPQGPTGHPNPLEESWAPVYTELQPAPWPTTCSPSLPPAELAPGDKRRRRTPVKRAQPWASEKPKQGKKKRSAGYVRPIIRHRKRVGQRLLDMLKSAPVPSRPPAMDVSKARCFPFADMVTKLNEWYGLQIDWPQHSVFEMSDLRSTRRMRQDELDRLDITLDTGLVRIRLASHVLEEEPGRAGECSLPSDGASCDDQDEESAEADTSLDSTSAHIYDSGSSLPPTKMSRTETGARRRSIKASPSSSPVGPN